MKRVAGVILAGGRASRYSGEPKGLLEVGGLRIIDRVAAGLREVCDDLLLVSNDPAAVAWLPGVPVRTDVRPGMGSLGGVYSALVHAGGPAIVVAWDMPFVPLPLLRELRRVAENEEVDVVVPESDTSPRGLEPMCAYYGLVCLAAIEHQLDAGDLRMIGFYETVRVARVPFATVQEMGEPAYLFLNVNTPSELARAQGYAAAHGHDRGPETFG